MTDKKPVTVTSAGSGKTREVAVEPGDKPQHVLAQVVDGDPDKFRLRSGANHQFADDADVYEAVDEGDALYSGTDAVFGAT